MWNSGQPPETVAVGADRAAENEYECADEPEYADIVRRSPLDDSTGRSNGEVAASDINDNEPVVYTQIKAVQDHDLYANVWL